MGSSKSKQVKPLEMSKEDKLIQFHEIMKQVKEKENNCDSNPKSRQQCIDDVNKWAHEQLPQNGGGCGNENYKYIRFKN